MGGLKRFGLIVFALAGVLSLVALILPWVGPYQNVAITLINNDYYAIVLQVLIAITAVGLAISLLRGLLTPRQRKAVVIEREGGDSITVSTKAISSQASHIVEAGDRFVAEKVRVTSKGRKNVSVDVRVRPRHTVDLTQEGKNLHEALTAGLSTICGDHVSRLNVEFVEAESPEPAQDVVIERVEDLEIPASVYERAAEMGTSSASATSVLGATEALEPDAIEGEGE